MYVEETQRVRGKEGETERESVLCACAHVFACVCGQSLFYGMSVGEYN